jgi:hypothetical protein
MWGAFGAPHMPLNFVNGEEIWFMLKKRPGMLFIILTFLISACSSQASPNSTAVAASPTVVDPCSAEGLPVEVEKIHKHMREFDDASLIAANAPINQLTDVISEMQRIRRDTEDQSVPACLTDLKKIQLAHMNTVIETTVAFLGGADPEILREGIALSRQQHNQYAIEYARLLGLTVVVLPTSTPLIPAAGTQAPSPSGYVAVNSGTDDVQLYSEPSETSSVMAVLVAGGSVNILAQSSDSVWLSVALPGDGSQSAWVQASRVTILPSP